MKPEVQTSDTIAMVKATIAEGWKLPPDRKIRLYLKDGMILEVPLCYNLSSLQGMVRRRVKNFITYLQMLYTL